MVLEATVQEQSSKQSLPLIDRSSSTLNNQMIKHQLPHMQFDQISDHKHGIYLYGKLYTKLLGQAANKNIKFMFTKLDSCFFLMYGFRSDCLEKF